MTRDAVNAQTLKQCSEQCERFAEGMSERTFRNIYNSWTEGMRWIRWSTHLKLVSIGYTSGSGEEHTVYLLAALFFRWNLWLIPFRLLPQLQLPASSSFRHHQQQLPPLRSSCERHHPRPGFGLRQRLDYLWEREIWTSLWGQRGDRQGRLPQRM